MVSASRAAQAHRVSVRLANLRFRGHRLPFLVPGPAFRELCFPVILFVEDGQCTVEVLFSETPAVEEQMPLRLHHALEFLFTKGLLVVFAAKKLLSDHAFDELVVLHILHVERLVDLVILRILFLVVAAAGKPFLHLRASR